MNYKIPMYIALAAFIIAGLLAFNNMRITGNVINSGEQASISSQQLANLEGEKLPINKERSQFEFEGYALEGIKTHVGSFNIWSGDLFKKDGKIIGFSGEIDVSSVNTGIERLDTHLKSEDFFKTEQFPKIELKNAVIKDNQATGELTFLGTTKTISFPVKVLENAVSAEFFFNAKDFGLSYPTVKDEVRIKFNFVA